MDFSDPKIVTGLIVAISAIVGAAIGAYAKAYTLKQKANELREAYNQKLQDNYLAKAAEYTESVYVPLNISLSKLSYQFNNFRAKIEDKSNQELIKSFVDHVDDFLSSVADLSSRGANAFLTTELDEKLQSFSSFLSESKTAEFSTLKMVIGFSLPYFGSRYKDEIEKKMTGRFARSLWSPRMSISFGGLGLSYEAKEILAAPIHSKDYEERFVRDIRVINVLIKEVTLGAKAKKHAE